jgi:hypothetical protein
MSRNSVSQEVSHVGQKEASKYPVAFDPTTVEQPA